MVIAINKYKSLHKYTNEKEVLYFIVISTYCYYSFL